MRLIVYDIPTGGTQTQYIQPSANKAIKTITPHLIRVGSPAGSVTFQITDSDGNLITSTNTRSISSFGSGTHWHGYANFDVNFHMRADTIYGIKLVTSGYTAGGTYIGWCSGYDLGSYPGTYTNVSTLGVSAPLDMKIWVERLVRKGIP